MLFNSFDFLIFFPIVLLILYIIPKSWRRSWLLLSSYYFYMSWNPQYALLIFLSTVITYLCALYVEKVDASIPHASHSAPKISNQNQATKQRKKKQILFVSLFINLAILVLFKYLPFIFENLNILFAPLGIRFFERKYDLLLPVGISFYTFQALGYTIDVYRKKVTEEKNFINYALFVSFFPQLVAGPIERSYHLISQIREYDHIDLNQKSKIHEGILLMLWGFFQKIVIADRAAILVDQVFGNYEKYDSISILTAAFLFSIQIYCDFDGYTNIARGSAKIMGIDLMVNFRQPYFAHSIKDFWKRWHLSLTTWFKDYVYIPMGGNRKSWARTQFNIFAVFLLSGIWHGARWNFVLWGLIHALLYFVKSALEKLKNRTSLLNKSSISEQNHQTSLATATENNRQAQKYSLLKRIVTFTLVSFAWIFFRADSATHAFAIIKQIIMRLFREVPYFETATMDIRDIKVLGSSLVILLLVDYVKEEHTKEKFFKNIPTGFKMTLYFISLWILILFGVYGVGYDVSQFIYFQF